MSEETQQWKLEECYGSGCRVAPGCPHAEGCDWAKCPDCGEQLFMHECEFWPEDADGPNRAPIWHGSDPLEEVARAMGWWKRVTGIEKPVEDDTRVRVAVALKMVTWDRDAQRYVIGSIDKARLDCAMAES